MSNLSEQKPTFDLKKYLHDVYELEKQKYLLEERNERLNEQKEEKEEENYQAYVSPDFQQSPYYQNWTNEYKNLENPLQQVNLSPQEKITGKLVAVLAIVGFFIGTFTGCASTFSHSSSGIVTWPLFAFPIIGIIIGLIIGSTVDSKNEKEYDMKLRGHDEINNNINQENKRKQSYNNERYYYWQSKFNNEENAKKEEDNKKKNIFEIKKSAQIDYIEKEKNLIAAKINELDLALDSIYNVEIDGKLCLHPAYRGLSSVAVIYGYLDTGRCTQLEGHEGAYNIYEQEKRLGYIIDKLDIISNKLDHLNGTMMYLGQAIYQCNDKLDQLNENSMKTLQAIEYMDMDISAGMNQLSKGMDSVSGNLSGISQSLSNIEVNSANSAYYAEVGSKAATFSAYYDMFKN